MENGRHLGLLRTRDHCDTGASTEQVSKYRYLFSKIAPDLIIALAWRDLFCLKEDSE